MEKKTTYIEEPKSTLVYSTDSHFLAYYENGKKLEEVFENVKANCAVPSDCKIGYVTEVAVLERKTREGQSFNQIQFEVLSEGRKYRKRYSIDFCRKYLNQLKVKAAECKLSIVIFKVNEAMYRSIGYFAFIDAAVNPDTGATDYFSCPYVDEGADYSAQLEKLGL